MKPNVGEVDRHFRFVAAGALLATAFVGRLSWPWRIATLLLGTSELLTATTQHCPINSLLGVDTNHEPSSGPAHQPPGTPEAVMPSGPIQDLAE